jgi:hypothetical protein
MSDDHGHADDDREAGRVTSPMQEFSMGQVTSGFVVLLVGLAVAYALPLVL